MTIRRGNTIVAGIASTVVLDNTTTSWNENDAVQSIGLVNKNTSNVTPVYNWVGTLAQYTAQDIEHTHPEWICYITDDGESQVSPWCLFDFKYTDYILSNPNWVNADANAWCTSTNYPNAYNHLVADQAGGTQETETIGSYTITFYRATDGHKVCLADQAETIANIFTETGVAWYYLLDTQNSRFKLPRNNYYFCNRNSIGNLTQAGLPNITSPARSYGSSNQGAEFNGAICYAGYDAGLTMATNTPGTGAYLPYMKFDASLSNPIYGKSLTVQPLSVNCYLMIYCN